LQRREQLREAAQEERQAKQARHSASARARAVAAEEQRAAIVDRGLDVAANLSGDALVGMDVHKLVSSPVIERDEQEALLADVDSAVLAVAARR
jgi:hypothetical protein